MANPEHVERLKQGVNSWNMWRMRERPNPPDLSGADLNGMNLSKADLAGVNLAEADLIEADLSAAFLTGAKLELADFSRANLRQAGLRGADLFKAVLSEADLVKADLGLTNLSRADISKADLSGAELGGADLRRAHLFRANLSGANLVEANLSSAMLSGANLSGANLREAILVKADLTHANLDRCRIYGVSAWNVAVNEDTKQQGLVVTAPDEPEVTVDYIEVAQFVHLMLHNEKVREAVDTIGRKAVLLLGRFAEGRIVILDRLRDELRKRGFLPIAFSFAKPVTKQFAEIVGKLAGLSRFVILDVTNPKSAPFELEATVPECTVPFIPIIAAGEKPFAALEDLWVNRRDWVFEPLPYSSLQALIGALDEKIIAPAEVRFAELLAMKAERLRGEQA